MFLPKDYLNNCAMWCLARCVFVTGCGFRIPSPSLPCTLLGMRATEIPRDVDKEKNSTGGFLAAESPLTVLGINLYPAH